jgi:hypothetical protein
MLMAITISAATIAWNRSNNSRSFPAITSILDGYSLQSAGLIWKWSSIMKQLNFMNRLIRWSPIGSREWSITLVAFGISKSKLTYASWLTNHLKSPSTPLKLG